MLTNVLLGFFVMLLCLILQIILLVAAIRYYFKQRFSDSHNSVFSTIYTISGVLLLLLLGNLGQIAIWALLFIGLGEFDLFNTAFYHSAVNFTSLGYGDIVMSNQHRLLGALEALNGIIMIGISTAALTTPLKDVFSHSFKNELNKKID